MVFSWNVVAGCFQIFQVARIYVDHWWASKPLLHVNRDIYVLSVCVWCIKVERSTNYYFFFFNFSPPCFLISYFFLSLLPMLLGFLLLLFSQLYLFSCAFLIYNIPCYALGSFRVCSLPRSDASEFQLNDHQLFPSLRYAHIHMYIWNYVCLGRELSAVELCLMNCCILCAHICRLSNESNKSMPY